MKKFNINQIMNDKSKAENNTEIAFKIENIQIDKIKPSEMNKYTVDDIEDLKSSIELIGLQQNLVVRPNQDETYELISGHRRYKAIKELYDAGDESFKKIPCKVIKSTDDIQAELQLILANSTARVLTDYEKTYQTGRLKAILEELKKSGYKIEGRKRDIVAGLLKVSASQVGIMESINKNLTPELKDKFKDKEINITKAYELSRKTEEEQKEVLEEYKESGDIKLESKKENKSEVPAAVIEKEEEQEQTELLKNNYEKIKGMTIEQMAEFLYIHLSKKGLKKTLEWLKESEEII